MCMQMHMGHSYVEFHWVHWTQKLAAKKSRFKLCELFSVCALQQIAWSQNFSNWPAKTCANRMLGSADPDQIDFSDWSAA